MYCVCWGWANHLGCIERSLGLSPPPTHKCSTPALTRVSYALPVQRPVIHPLSSPSNRFCVTSLDPDTLPAVATLLMDVMFYSNG